MIYPLNKPIVILNHTIQLYLDEKTRDITFKEIGYLYNSYSYPISHLREYLQSLHPNTIINIQNILYNLKRTHNYLSSDCSCQTCEKNKSLNK